MGARQCPDRLPLDPTESARPIRIALQPRAGGGEGDLAVRCTRVSSTKAAPAAIAIAKQIRR
jgi:hypothetical protein